jgi:hypothetical protein
LARRSLLVFFALIAASFCLHWSYAAEKSAYPKHPTLCKPENIAKLSAATTRDLDDRCAFGAQMDIVTQQCTCKQGFVENGKDRYGRIMCRDSQQADFTAYIAELQRKIRSNWKAPFYYNIIPHRTATAVFKILPDGSMVEPCFKVLTNDARYDEKAYKAILRSAPFAPLPKDYKGKDIDVQFIFDMKYP